MAPDKLKISVILCTRNPNQTILRDVLGALSSQSLPSPEWELVVVDNASNVPLKEGTDFSWPTNSRIIRELRPGLTAARACGINAVSSPVVMFLDDDNFLAADYLAQALQVAAEWPQLGTWGGSIVPRWQHQPPEWTRRYWNWLAIRELDGDRWSNAPVEASAHPYGAGMCVRRDVALRYVADIATSPLRQLLDRTGDCLFGGGDADLNYTAIAMGYGTGVFCRLKMEHWMPEGRLTEEYLLRLVEDMTCSHHLLAYSRGGSPSLPSRSQRILNAYQGLFIDARWRRFDRARFRGLKRALEMIAAAKSNARQEPSGQTCQAAVSTAE